MYIQCTHTDIQCTYHTCIQMCQCHYSGISLLWKELGQTKRGVLISEVVKYTNVAFGTDESVLFMDVSFKEGFPFT